MPTVAVDDLNQSHQAQCKKLSCWCRKAHLVTTATCLSLVSAHGSCAHAKHSVLDVQHALGIQPLVHDPFELEKPHHVLETVMNSGKNDQVMKP